MTLIVTGAAGFIGASASKYFKAKGFRVIGIDRQPLPETLRAVFDRYEELSLPDSRLEGLLAEEKPEHCLHCAGESSVSFSLKEPEQDFQSHVPVTYSLLNAIRLAAPACKTIFVSSAAVYGNPQSLPISENARLQPISPYGYHKMSCELICRQFSLLYKLKTCSVRLFSAYGAGLKRQLLWDIYQKAKTAQALELHGTGEETRDFIHIADIARVMEIVFSCGDFQAGVYNVADGKAIAIKQIAELMIKQMGLNIPIIFSGRLKSGDPLYWQADISRLLGLGYRPSISLGAGIHSYVSWCHETEA